MKVSIVAQTDQGPAIARWLGREGVSKGLEPGKVASYLIAQARAAIATTDTERDEQKDKAADLWLSMTPDEQDEAHWLVGNEDETVKQLQASKQTISGQVRRAMAGADTRRRTPSAHARESA